MKFIPQEKRFFKVGLHKKIHIADCGKIELEPDEQVTFTTPTGAEYDVARKDWGFYATPSTNSRLASFGLRTVLVRNSMGRAYVFLVERGKEESFEQYLADEGIRIVCWLDSDAAVEAVVQKLEK
jgi:hypothetical protein